MKKEGNKKTQEFRERIKYNPTGIKHTYFINPESSPIVNPRKEYKTLKESCQISMP